MDWRGHSAQKSGLRNLGSGVIACLLITALVSSGAVGLVLSLSGLVSSTGTPPGKVR